MKDCKRDERSSTGWAARGVEIFAGMIGGRRKMTREAEERAKEAMVRRSLLFVGGMIAQADRFRRLATIARS